MLKTYITSGTLAIKLPMKGGGVKQVVFDSGDGNKGVYVTRDKDVQESLEAFRLFGNAYMLERAVDEEAMAQAAEEAKAKVAKEAEEAGRVYNVVTLQEARNILIDEYGVKNGDIRGKANTLAKAAELGITFNGLE